MIRSDYPHGSRFYIAAALFLGLSFALALATSYKLGSPLALATLGAVGAGLGIPWFYARFREFKRFEDILLRKRYYRRATGQPSKVVRIAAGLFVMALYFLPFVILVLVVSAYGLTLTAFALWMGAVLGEIVGIVGGELAYDRWVKRWQRKRGVVVRGYRILETGERGLVLEERR